jgi:hypothetical protein
MGQRIAQLMAWRYGLGRRSLNAGRGVQLSNTVFDWQRLGAVGRGGRVHQDRFWGT